MYDAHRGADVQIDFFEFDEGKQDENLFTIPSWLESLCSAN